MVEVGGAFTLLLHWQNLSAAGPPRERSGCRTDQQQWMDCSTSSSALLKHRDGQGLLRIHFVVAFTESFNCQILLEHGAGVNDETTVEQTPLHLASVKWNPDVAEVHCYLLSSLFPLCFFQLLLEEEAYRNAVDNKGNTPLHYAAMYGRPETAKVSQREHAQFNGPFRYWCFSGPQGRKPITVEKHLLTLSAL